MSERRGELKERRGRGDAGIREQRNAALAVRKPQPTYTHVNVCLSTKVTATPLGALICLRPAGTHLALTLCLTQPTRKLAMWEQCEAIYARAFTLRGGVSDLKLKRA